MSVFKIFFQIVNKNRMPFLIAIGINLFLTLTFVQSTKNESQTFNSDKMKIAVINHDQGLVGKDLEHYLEDKTQIVSIDTSEKAQQDALFFNVTPYILTIPKDFSTSLAKNIKPIVEKKNIPQSKGEYQTDALINNYLNKFVFYQKQYPKKSTSDLLELVNQTLDKKPKVVFLKDASGSLDHETTPRIFNLLAYGLFMSIISSVSLVSLSLNKSEIQNRIACSPLSKRKQSYYYYLATGVFSIVCWIIFFFMSFILSDLTLGQAATGLYFLNAITFLFTIIALSVTVGYFVKNNHMVSVINNIVVLGTCFISGVFVPQSILSDNVLKISSFFPTYWFVANNHLIASLGSLNQENLRPFFLNIGTLCLFTLLFLCIGLLIRKESSKNKLI